MEAPEAPYLAEGLSPAARRHAHFLLREVNRAVREFDMIHPGDRIAVAVSGGKDSLSLLNLLYGGNTVSLAPRAAYFGGRFCMIRPLIYTPESELARFARLCGFPPPPPACARSASSNRRRVSEMLKLLGRDYLTQARQNLIRAGLRAYAKYEGDRGVH